MLEILDKYILHHENGHLRRKKNARTVIATNLQH